MTDVEIKDSVVWFKDIHSAVLLHQLVALPPEAEVTLMADQVIGPWLRMRSGPDGRPTLGIKPAGSMKKVWADWYKTRRGDYITLRAVTMSDDYLAALAPLFTEWTSPEDEAAFGDL